MIIFIVTRLLDIITTLLNINKYGGWEVELNPLVRNIGSNGIYSFVAYQFTIIILAIVLVERFRIKNLVYISFSIISMIAVAINIWCLFL